MGWVVLLIAIALLAIAIAGWRLFDNYGSDSGFLLFATGLICLVCIVIIGPINYYCTISEIVQYKAFEATVERSRTQTMDSIERAAIVRGIAEKNEWLANRQYWNQTVFDWFIPDEVEKLEPLK